MIASNSSFLEGNANRIAVNERMRKIITASYSEVVAQHKLAQSFQAGNGENPATYMQELSGLLEQSIVCLDKAIASYGSKAPMVQMQPWAKWKSMLASLKSHAETYAQGQSKFNPQSNKYDSVPFTPEAYTQQ